MRILVLGDIVGRPGRSFLKSRLGEVKNTNPNVAWIDERGTWWFYIGMLALSRYAMFVFGFSSEAAWCAVISSHALITYWLIHYKVT